MQNEENHKMYLSAKTTVLKWKFKAFNHMILMTTLDLNYQIFLFN